jgi:hypothetical protein
MRETLRLWLEGTETYVLEVILEKRQGKIAEILRGILCALSRVYGAVIKGRRFLYNVSILRVKQPFGKRTYSFWKVLLVALVISAFGGILLAILIPTRSH